MKYQVRIMIKPQEGVIKSGWKKLGHCYKVHDSNTMSMSLPKWWEAVQNELRRKGYVGDVFLQACIGNDFGKHSRLTETGESLGFKQIARVTL